MKFRKLLLLAAFLILPPITAFSQNTNTVLRGTISDPNGAAIAGAKVTLTGAAPFVTRNTQRTSKENLYLPICRPPAIRSEFPLRDSRIL